MGVMNLEIGGVVFRLNPAAISAIRYRAEYGDSVVNHLAACKTQQEEEGVTLRMCYKMLSGKDAGDIAVLASCAHSDKKFMEKAARARAALLCDDPMGAAEKAEEADTIRFDEYGVLALMVAARMDMQLLYELPILHIASVLNRCFAMQDTEHKNYHRMNEQEMATLYPR